MELMEILKGAVEKKASDIFIISGLAVTYKENGIITKESDDIILPAEAERLIKKYTILQEGIYQDTRKRATMTSRYP